jgi:hypothetical protein
LAIGLGWAAAHLFPVQRAFPPRHRDEHFFKVVNKPAPQAASLPFGHPYYRYSIIPGGAYTVAELKAALERDPVAAAHYSDFNLAKARLMTLDADMQFYVSYRVGDKIYWTRRLITLHKGEQVITDGVNLARIRCGNRLRLKPSEPADIGIEPVEKVFEAPAFIATGWVPKPPQTSFDAGPGPDIPMEILSNDPGAMPPVLQALVDTPAPAGWPVARDYIPTPNEHEKPPIFAFDGPNPVAVLPVFFPSETPPASAVPEPGTAALGSLSLVAITLLRRRLKRS